MADSKLNSLAIALRPIIRDEVCASLDNKLPTVTDHNTVTSQETNTLVLELTAKVDNLMTQLTNIEKVLSGGKKSIVKSEKKATEKTDSSAVKIEAGETVSFPSNAMLYFKMRLKRGNDDDTEYIAKFVGEELIKKAEADNGIKSKKNETQRKAAIGTYIWNYLKINEKDTVEKIKADYTEAKTAHEAASAPEPAEIEDHTPS